MISVRVIESKLRKSYATNLMAVLALVLAMIFVTLSQAARAATTVTITSPTSGSSATGSSFTVTGTATADRNILVKVNGVEVGTTISDGSGNWSLAVTGQSAGAKAIEAIASVSYAYVPNAGSTNMSIINAVTDEVINTVSTSSIQTQANVSPDGTQMITCSGFGVGNQVKVWNLADPETPVITHNLTVPGAHALSCLYSPNGSYFYVTSEAADFSGGTVTRFDTADPNTSAAVTGYNQNMPAAISFKSDSSIAYVGNVISSTMSVIDVATNTQTATFSGGSGGGGGPLMSDDIHGYSSGAGANAVIPYNVQTLSFGTPISVGNSPRGPVYNQDQSSLVVANYNDDTLSIIGTGSNTVTDTINLTAGAAPNRLLFSNDYSKAYVAEGGLDRVSILNPSTFTSIGTISVGDNPSFFSFGPTESTTASTSFTLVAASSGSEALADTGTNVNVILAFISVLLVTGAVGLRFARKN